MEITPLTPHELEELEELCEQILAHPANNSELKTHDPVNAQFIKQFNAMSDRFIALTGPDKVLALVRQIKTKNRPDFDMSKKSWSIVK